MSTFSILTLGCRANQTDSEQISELLRTAGFEEVRPECAADLGIVNTCTVTAEADRKAGQMIRRLSRLCQLVIVTGCSVAPKGGLSDRSSFPENVLVVPPSQRDRILDFIPTVKAEPESLNSSVVIADATDKHGEVSSAEPFTSPELNIKPHRVRALLKVQEGCNHMCTFCIVPLVRGPLRSLQANELLPRLHELVERGYHEVVLTGTHLALWGRDTASKRRFRGAAAAGTAVGGSGVETLSTVGLPNFADLLEELIKGSQGVRLRISSIEPMAFPVKILELMRAYPDRLCPHLHLVIQHASDKILAAMHRDYTLAQYDSLAQEFLRTVPGACLTTDVLVGFPGETEEDVQILLDYLKRTSFYHLHVFPYSQRAGTAAAGFSNQVPAQVKHERVRRVIALGEESARRVYASFVGTVRPVLAERSSPRPGYLLGRADNFLEVEFPGVVEQVGKIFQVAIPPRV